MVCRGALVVYITWSEDDEGMVGDRETKWDVGRVRHRDCEFLRWDRSVDHQKRRCGPDTPVWC